MSELEFEAITVVDAQVVNANAGQMDNVTITELQAHRGDGADPLQNTWKLKPLYISSKVKRLNATGGIFKTVRMEIRCEAIDFRQTFETRLEMYDGSHNGCIAEIVSVFGVLSPEVPKGVLEVTVVCEGEDVPHLKVPVSFAGTGSSLDAELLVAAT